MNLKMRPLAVKKLYKKHKPFLIHKNLKKKHVLLVKTNQSSIERNRKKQKTFFKLKKKWRFWRFFKKAFLSQKKITFFEKLNSRYNEIRMIWHQLSNVYSSKIKNIIYTQLRKEKNHLKFFFFLNKFELRLSTLLLRGRFFYKIINCLNSIKLNLISINGLIINNVNYVTSSQDLIQKRRIRKKKQILSSFRGKRLKWRSYRWKKARFLFWKIRRLSHFNLFWNKKQNTVVNYLEINYKIPAFIVIKQPFIKELVLLKQPKLLTNLIFKKIYFLY